MKIVCSRNELIKSMNISIRAVPARTTMNILECVLIDASTNVIRFTTNDMELAIETVVEGTVIEKGIVALDAKIFFEIIRKLPDNDVTISVDENHSASITCEKAKFHIPGKSGEDYTGVPPVIRQDSLVISQFTLREMIRQTIFSVAMNENNKMMTGELFEIKDNRLRIVSLDGHRISMRVLPLAGEYENRKVIVPGKTLNEIIKTLSGEMDDSVSIFFGEDHLIFEIDKTIMVSRLIDGEYFHVDQMISRDYETSVVVNRREFLDCIDRSSLLVKEGDKKPLILRIKDDEMEIYMESQFGTMTEEIDITKEGKDIVIGFNPRFLMDALRVISEEEVTIYLMNGRAPCFIRNEEAGYTYLILPVNINQNM